MKAFSTQCPGYHEPAIPVLSRLFAAVRTNVRCPACGVSFSLSRWPRVVHLALGEAAVAVGFVASLMLETPLYLGLAAVSWFGFGIALPLSESDAGTKP